MDGALLYSYTIDSGNIPQNFIGRRQQQLSYHTENLKMK